MIKSMTGFGRAEIEEGNFKITVEMKSVNHRYCDVSIKIPKKLSFFESVIRNEVKKYASRGKIDIFVSYEDFTEGKSLLKYNKEIAESYVKGLEQISNDFSLENNMDVYKIARFPEVFVLEDQEMDTDEFGKILVKAVDTAAEQFNKSRVKEGEILKHDIINKLDGLLDLVTFIDEKYPDIMNAHRERLMTKVQELLGDTQIDETVLATEMIVYSDKICVDEETVRLRSHITHMKDTFEDKDSIGRKLDFIAQEMNREANTILSKANDIDISNHAIELKTEIEKIREQIQNIE